MFPLMLLVIIYIAFISLGLPDSMVGAAWPMMYSDLKVPVSFAGMISLTICLGTTLSSLVYSRLSQRFTTWGITSVSVAMTAVSLLLYSIAPSFAVILLISLVLGMGAGAVDAGLNNYVALHYRARAMNFLHAFWGMGTLVGPFLLSYYFANGISWRCGYLTIGSIQSAVCILLILSMPLWRKAGEKPIAEEGKEPKLHQETLPLLAAIRLPGAKAAMLGFFSYCAMEQTSMLWASTFLVSIKGFTESAAAASAGLLFWGITTGRILSGLIADKIRGRHMIRASQCSILIGIILVALSPEWLAGGALFFLGMGFGPIYPTMLHQTPEYFGIEHSGRIMGLEMTSAYLSCALMPAFFGIIGRGISMLLFPFYVLLFLALNAAATETKARIRRI